MPIGRRLTTLLTVLTLVAIPAVVSRALCLGKSCTSGQEAASAAVPFCPLPAELRGLVSAGFRQGRSPDAMATTAVDTGGVQTRSSDDLAVPWPSLAQNDTLVPIAFAGTGLTGRSPASGTGLDQIAPTLAAAMGFQRSHPEVRSGLAAQGVAGAAPDRERRRALAVEIVWKGIGTPDLLADRSAWPFLRSMIHEGGTLEGTTGSLPLDPAAMLTTIGTGGLPSQHGVTGTLLRADDGATARAWGPGAPGSVIATLADDVDRASGQRAFVAGILSARSDRGIVGDGWYLDRRDRDRIVVTDDPLTALSRLVDEASLEGGVIGVVLRGSVARVDRLTREIVGLVRNESASASFVVTATGSLRGPAGTSDASVASQVEGSLDAPVIEGSAAGGFFLDRTVAASQRITVADVITAMDDIHTPTEEPLFGDTFPSFAVAFSRYC